MKWILEFGEYQRAAFSRWNDAPVLKPFGLYREEGPAESHLGL